jgi:decaprenylphospho-beta-D-erythro-pentofuranosid-2-ulose 2-reductase
VIDAVGNVGKILVLGGSSAIARATVAQLSSGRPGLQVVLAARPGEHRDDAAREATAHGATVTTVDLDVTDVASCRNAFAEAKTGADIDLVLVAFGILGDQEAAWQDVDAAVGLADVNYRGAVVCGVLAAELLRLQGYGALVLLSSVAGERVRRTNFAYGASKAGADAFYVGLGEAVEGDGVHVMVVRPGFVRSPMTAGLTAPPLSQTPEQVATVIAEGLRRRARIVWAPPPMRAVMSVLRHIPTPVFRRLPL